MGITLTAEIFSGLSRTGHMTCRVQERTAWIWLLLSSLSSWNGSRPYGTQLCVLWGRKPEFFWTEEEIKAFRRDLVVGTSPMLSGLFWDFHSINYVYCITSCLLEIFPTLINIFQLVPSAVGQVRQHEHVNSSCLGFSLSSCVMRHPHYHSVPVYSARYVTEKAL